MIVLYSCIAFTCTIVTAVVDIEFYIPPDIAKTWKK